MSISDELINKVKNAYTDFANTVSKTEHDDTIKLLTELHHNAQALIDGKVISTAGSEFSHALAALDRLPQDVKALPTMQSELETKVGPDGALMGVGKWELYDPGWLESLEQWFVHYNNKAAFNTQPQHIQIADSISFVIAGDWGTGNWRNQSPSDLVSQQMVNQQADYSIHLGDVYYSATKSQEINNLVEIWPVGKKGCFTLNSNHEMYDGAFSYYEQALAHKFVLQKGCSYFALENTDWLIVGIDTAYHADPMDLYLKGKLGDAQLSWLKTLPQNKKIILLSHHEGYDITGKKQSQVYEQVTQSLEREPDFWYWGHLHNGIVYQPQNRFHGRCMGHGSIPYGNASSLEGNENVQWYETKTADDPDIPLRVLNGFACLSLENDKLNEKIIAENGDVRLQNQY